RRGYSEAFVIGLQVFGAGLGHDLEQLVFGRRAVFLDHHDAFAVEAVHHAAALAQVAAVLFEGVLDVGRGALAVVGQGLNDDRHAARRVTLVHQLFGIGARQFARAAFDGAVNVGGRHVFFAGLKDGVGEAVVGLRV